MSNFHYHRATLADIQILVDSRVAFLSEYWGNQSDELEKPLRVELKKYFEKAIQYETYISWIAKHDEAFAGIGGIVIQQRAGSFRVPDGRNGYIMNMYTKPEYRKQGIATVLLEKLISSGKAIGLNFFELHSTTDGEPIYVKNGFELHKEPTYRKFTF